MKIKTSILSLLIAICFSCKTEIKKGVVSDQNTSAITYLEPQEKDQFLGPLLLSLRALRGIRSKPEAIS